MSGKVSICIRLFDETLAHFGKLDILVNNAAILFNQPVSSVTEAEFDRIFAVNVKGTFFACQQAATRLADGGRIINFSSTTTVMMLPTYGAYVATKGAVEQLTRSLARELGPRGITVTQPGPIFLKRPAHCGKCELVPGYVGPVEQPDLKAFGAGSEAGLGQCRAIDQIDMADLWGSNRPRAMNRYGFAPELPPRLRVWRRLRAFRSSPR